MMKYEFLNLVVSIFTAIGTCGATILALYFWLNDKKIKLSCRILQADNYGNVNLPHEENGYFVVILTNRNYIPLKLELAGLAVYKNAVFKKRIGVSIFENTQFDILPKRLESGESYIYVISIVKMQDRLKKFKQEKKVDIIDLKIYVGVSTANRDISYKVPKEIKSILIK